MSDHDDLQVPLHTSLTIPILLAGTPWSSPGRLGLWAGWLPSFQERDFGADSNHDELSGRAAMEVRSCFRWAADGDLAGELERKIP
ncbi:MAG: hypothetical protein ACR2QH_11995 [Geminicoccaceae bacterium]